jgi:hypothetical protein
MVLKEQVPQLLAAVERLYQLVVVGVEVTRFQQEKL